MQALFYSLLAALSVSAIFLVGIIVTKCASIFFVLAILFMLGLKMAE